MSDICLDSSKCKAVIASVDALKIISRKYDENNAKLQETNIHLVKVTGVIETQTQLLKVYKATTDRDLKILFDKAVENAINLAHVEGNLGIEVATGFGELKTLVAEEVGKINTSQAKKLGLWDIGKIIGLISGVIALFGLLYSLFAA